ncbi:MAG TPA: S8 family serine peptidase [Candidatus Polarisedimenticolia bacterium]|nr:S8 family serine peptidase [Candidatus Polarisedimenticolia bacterium]
MKRALRFGLYLAVALLLLLPAWQMSISSSGKDKTRTPGQKVGHPPQPGADYQSPGDRHKVQVSDRATIEDLKGKGHRLIADYGSYALIEVDAKTAKTLREKPGVERRDEYNLVMLNTGALDTTKAEIQALKGKPTDPRFNQLHMIQFAGPIRPEWHQELLKTGVQVVTYIPSNTYVVYGNRGALHRLQSFANSANYVQWEGAYQSQYKIDPSVDTVELDKANLGVEGLYGIQLIDDKEQNPETLALIEQLALEPIVSQFRVLDYLNVIVKLAPDAGIEQIAKQPDVISIAPYEMPTKMDERQDMIVAGNITAGQPDVGDYLAYLGAQGFTQGQFTSSGFAVNLSDSGIDNATTSPNHFGLYVGGLLPGTSRIIYNRLEGTPNSGSTLQGCDGHGTLNSHVIGGFVPGSLTGFPFTDASGFRYGLGVCPFVKIGSSVIFDPNSFTFPNILNLESKAYNDGARISSNSWGANTAGAYNINSQTYDAVVRDAQPAGSTFPAAGNQEYVIVFAAGNAGPGSQTVGAPGTAKNVITAGASENVRSHNLANGGNSAAGTDGCSTPDTGADSPEDIIGFSSRGPTTDGRRKPDLVAPGTHVTGGVFQVPSPGPNGTADACFVASGVCALPGSGASGDPDNFFPLGQQFYTTSSGTSHSTPAIAGITALVRQRFINAGKPVPSPALTKAVLMNTARYLTGAGANDTLWSNSQGMGEVYLNSFFDTFVTPTVMKDEVPADMFTATGQQRVVTGVVNNPAKAYRVTLAWTDPPGPTSGNAFVNNLDLEVTVGGVTYKGNVFSGAFSTSGGSADTRNNVESVFIPAGVTGSFIVKVTATNIAGDGVPNFGGALDQDYALVVYNATEAALPVMSAGTATFATESCSPNNSAPDPSETVTMNLAVQNIGTGNTTSLVGTLQATGGVSAPSAPQNYGVVVAGGPAVTRPFTFTVNRLCGQTVILSLQLQDGATDLGTLTYTFPVGVVGPGVPSSYSSGGIAVLIPDLTTVESSIVIPDAGVVGDVNVKVRLDHTFDGDLVISLVAPDGTVVNLSNLRGSSGDNFGTGNNDCSGTSTVFDDSAGTSIAAGAPPYAGSFTPEQPLSALNGKTITGTWKLRISDTANIDTGTLGCWGLEIDRRQFICCGVAGSPNISAVPPATLANEDCSPATGAVDPGETVTMNFALKNTGTANTFNLTAQLLATGGVTSPGGPVSYGTIITGGPAVSRPFTFVANATCGGTITATLHLLDGAVDLGNVSFTIPVGSPSAPQPAVTYTSTATPAALPDLTTTEVPLVISDSGFVGDVNAAIRLNHTFDGDLLISLVAPDGTSAILSNRRGSTGDNYGTGANDCSGVSTVFDDSSASLISGGTAPFSGTFKPDGALSVFNGKPLAGTWKLRVQDAASGDVGTLGCFKLDISRAVAACCGGGGSPSIVTATPVQVTSESCSAANSAPDPDETVTVSFPLRNVGTGHATNVVATLLPGGGVNTPSGPQSYGALLTGGPAVARSFTFVPSGTCGGSLTATLHLQDGALDLGNVSFPLTLGSTADTVSTFSNPASITIPGSGTGTSTGAPSTPYPSNITVAGLTGTVSKVTVRLINMNHTFPGDIDMLLVGPQGDKFIIFSDAGSGVDLVNNTVTLDDTAVALLPSATAIGTGTFRPTNYTTGDTFPVPAPAAPYQNAATAGTATFASVFNGKNPNGTWSLYVVDDASGDVGNISGGWQLTITTQLPACCVQACTLTCPGNIIRNADPGVCGATVSYTTGVSGTCGTLSTVPASGSLFPIGTTPVTSTATTSGGGVTTCGFNVTVNQIATVSTVTPTPGTQQYSDPVTFTATVTPGVCDSTQAATSVTFFVGTQNLGTVPLTPGGGGLQASLTRALEEPIPYGTAPTGQMAPGVHNVTAVLNGTSPLFVVTNPAPAPLTITQEDARATYTGALFVSTSSASSGTATVTLAATVQDITATPDAAGDGDFGDIRHATVTFINRDTNTAIATVPVGLVNGADTKTGTATYAWAVNIGTANSASFTVGIRVNNYYTRDVATEDTVITVSRPLSGDFITGGGYLVMSSSGGQVPGETGTKNNFGFDVKYNKSMTNLQGHINTIVRNGGRIYQIKGTVMTSLAVNSVAGTAVFNGRASIRDITNPLSPISIDGNASLQVVMTDNGEPGIDSDSIGITLWDKNGGLWFSSSWNGTGTAEQLLGGGNLKVPHIGRTPTAN